MVRLFLPPWSAEQGWLDGFPWSHALPCRKKPCVALCFMRPVSASVLFAGVERLAFGRGWCAMLMEGSGGATRPA